MLYRITWANLKGQILEHDTEFPNSNLHVNEFSKLQVIVLWHV